MARVYGPRNSEAVSRSDGRHPATRWNRCSDCRDDGFTLVELLIVIVVVPLVIGGLAVGLLSVFSLQSSVASRLSNTQDSQIVAATYRNDIQSAAQITTQKSSKPQCGSGTQLLGLEWDLNQVTGNFEDLVSYVKVQNGSTVSLERLYCTLGSYVPVSSQTLSYNVQSGQGLPTLYPAVEDTAAMSGWVSAQLVTDVEFSIFEPQGSNSYQYTLEAIPATNASVTETGGPLAPSTTTSCSFAAAGSGPLASSLCFIDFSPLTGNNLLAAEEGCIEMSVTLSGSYLMYFCLGISGDPVYATTLPTYEYAFLGNSGTYTNPTNGQVTSTGITPNYYNIPGDAALYQSCEGGTLSTSVPVPGTNVDECNYPNQGIGNTSGVGVTTLTFSQVKVVTPKNVAATGWQFVAADAESSDNGESIVWTSSNPLNVVNNGYTIANGYPTNVDTNADPFGNACSGTYTQVSPDSIMCVGANTYDAQHNSVGKTGAAMVESLMPNTFTIAMTGTGLEAVSVGLLVS